MSRTGAQMGEAAGPPILDGGYDLSRFVLNDEAGAARLNLLVEGLHCAGCVNRIERALSKEAGVREARVNLGTRRMRLLFDPAIAKAEGLIETVGALGYRLVPFDPAALDASDREEERMLLRSLAVAGFAAANVMLLSVSIWAGEASNDMGPATRDFLHWLSAMIALPAVAYAGRPFFRSAVSALRGGGLNMDVPISLAVVLASAMSLHEVATGGEHAYFDAAVTLVFFLLIGRYLDRRARGKARSAAEQMMLLDATAARVKQADGSLKAVPIDFVATGMTVTVATGERIPVDGTIIEGGSSVDASLVSGESLPVAIATGDHVFAGTFNLGRALDMRVTATGSDTLLGEIVSLMEAAEQGRARYVRLADRAARIYAPAVHGLAAVTFLGWLILGGGGWQPALLIAVAVLIITCPCALGLAVPVVQVVASGRLMRQGIIVKSGDALERIAEIDTVVFDKTGTLTIGEPRLMNAEDIAGDVLRLAASLAAASRHPLSKALVEAVGAVPVAANVHEEPGMGLSAEIDGQSVRLGNREWCEIAGETRDQLGRSELWLVRSGQPPVRFVFDDQLRQDAKTVIDALRDRGLNVELISGDRVEIVAPTAMALGITTWSAEQRPMHKVQRLEDLASRGRKVLMVGDGLNDAPALASAHASISPSRAVDVSRTAADVIFQGDALGPILEILRVSRLSRRLVLQNFALAAAYNMIALPLAMAGFVTPLIAAAAMSSSSLIVTLNALRLRLARPSSP
jgi:Cu2+-exporting ATPase